MRFPSRTAKGLNMPATTKFVSGSFFASSSIQKGWIFMPKTPFAWASSLLANPVEVRLHEEIPVRQPRHEKDAGAMADDGNDLSGLERPGDEGVKCRVVDHRDHRRLAAGKEDRR